MARFDRIDAAMVGLVLVWGSAFTAIRALRGHLDPFEMTWFRYLPFPIVYGAWLLVARRATLRLVTPSDWVIMTILGNLAVIGYHFPLNFAMAGTEPTISAATGALIISTLPVWTLSIAVLSGRERPRPRAVLGMAIALAGVALVVTSGTPDADISLAPAAALGVGAIIAWAIYGVFAKRLIETYGGLFTTGTTMILGTASLVPLGVSYGVAPLRGLDAAGWGWILFLSLVSTIGGYAVYNHALKHRAASDVASYIYLNPIVAVPVAWLLLGEGVTWVFPVGALLTIGGVVLVQRSRPKA